MKLTCVIDQDYQGNPRIKVTKDTPTVTIVVYTEDINLLKSWVDQELEIGVKE